MCVCVREREKGTYFKSPEARGDALFMQRLRRRGEVCEEVVGRAGIGSVEEDKEQREGVGRLRGRTDVCGTSRQVRMWCGMWCVALRAAAEVARPTSWKLLGSSSRTRSLG